MLEQNGEMSDARRGLLRDIERYAASVGCRHRRLVGYFGEAFTKDDCGACDYCLGELETVADPVDLARKILSASRASASASAPRMSSTCCAAARASGRGRAAPRAARSSACCATRRSTKCAATWISSSPRLLRQTDDGFPVLQLTPTGVALMKDAAAEPDLTLARQKRPEKNGAEARSGSKPNPGRAWTASCSSGCARCGCRWRANAACRRTSSSTTRRCASWRGSSRRRSTPPSRLRHRRAQGRRPGRAGAPGSPRGSPRFQRDQPFSTQSRLMLM